MIGAMLGLAMIALLWRYPEWSVSRIIAQMISVPIARRLMRLERRHLWYALMLVALPLIAGELIMVMGSVDIGLVLAWDVATYIDLLIITTLAGIGRRLEQGLRFVMALARFPAAGRMPGRPAKPRSRRTRAAPSVPPANDDDRPADRRAAA